MKTGSVKFFNYEKGFGFIVDDETGEDIFVHKTGLIDRTTMWSIMTILEITPQMNPRWTVQLIPF